MPTHLTQNNLEYIIEELNNEILSSESLHSEMISEINKMKLNQAGLVTLSLYNTAFSNSESLRHLINYLKIMKSKYNNELIINNL